MGSAATRGGRLPLAALLGGLLLLQGCERSPTDLPPEACTLPDLPLGFNAPVLSTEQLQSTLRDASTRMVLGLESSAATANLAASLGQLEGQIVSANQAEACVALLTVQENLVALPDELAILPDRTAVQLVLHLANAALRASQ